jgi:N-acylneuraminate cytidylyltransferase/CMP-N,N'-diacetyllegionaminic acid synthase
MNIIGLIPARGGSKGVPKKNIKDFNGRPLITYTINNALKSKYITHTVVSTDSQEIADISLEYGAMVPFLRPKELASDDATDLSVMKHAIEWFQSNQISFDYMVFLRPTSVFRNALDIDKAVEKIIGAELDSVRSISEVCYSPYWMKKIVDEKLINLFDSKYSETRRQDLPIVYQANGVVDVIDIKTVVHKGTRYGKKIGYYLMNDISRIDIDTPLDFEIAEILYSKYKVK